MINRSILLRSLWPLIFIIPLSSYALSTNNNHLKEPPNDCTSEYLSKNPEKTLPCYLQQKDDNYNWQHVDTSETTTSIDGKQQTVKVHTLTMNSQRWPINENYKVSHPVWRHNITIYQPKSITTSNALLYINGGTLYSKDNELLITDNTPNDDLNFARIAALSQSVVIDLKDVPNQFLQFLNPSSPPLKEDGLIAFTWQEYLNNPDKNHYMPLRLPMVKSTQRAMDTVQAFMHDNKIKLNEFVLTGLSKRGWAVWLTAAMDDRVIAIAPMVIDILNLQKSLDHHYNSYKKWAPAVKDYLELLPNLHSAGISKLMKIVDPIHYSHLLKMPKYVVTASADDFFLPDASRYYYDDLKGEKWLRTLPNRRHFIARMDKDNVTNMLASFYGAIIEQRPMPSVYWNVENDQLAVTSSTPPKYAKLWTAYNPEARDFRITPDNPGISEFESTPIDMRCNKVCRIKTSIANKNTGWQISFIELGFANAPYEDFIITTQPFITPDTYPAKPE